jgi:hypothetical protein
MTTLLAPRGRHAIIVALLLATPIAAFSADEARRARLEVTVEYTGAGEVSETHRLWIWVFDTPDFATGAAMPVAERWLSDNGGMATFEDVGERPVWIAVAFDADGGFAGNAPPRRGWPVSTHVVNGAPAPVTPGDAGRARIVFDDSMRMP